MFANQHNYSSGARQFRTVERIIRHRQNAAERIAAAQAKRDRKNAKRAQIAKEA